MLTRSSGPPSRFARWWTTFAWLANRSSCHRQARALSLPAIVVLAALALACSGRRDPIIVDEGMLVLENQTSGEWRNVRITVNNHFRGGAPVLAAGGRLNAPLTQFETGFGQRFDRWRMSVFKVEVTATAADGKPVALHWGKP